MHPGAVEVVAYQETLLLMAVFGVAILAMIWAGFRRWLEHKDKLGRITAEQSAERSAQYMAQMQRVEARLDAIEGSIPGVIAVQVGGRPATPDAEPDMPRAGM